MFVPDTPLAPDVVREFCIRTGKGLWEYHHQEEAHFYFERSGRNVHMGFTEAQLLQIMRGDPTGAIGEFKSARPSWYKRAKRLREQGRAATLAAIRNESHPHHPLIGQLATEMTRRALARNDAVAHAWAGNPARVREASERVLSAFLCPDVTTEWLFTGGDLNNGCPNFREAVGDVFGVKLRRSAPNTAFVAAYEPVRARLTGVPASEGAAACATA